MKHGTILIFLSAVLTPIFAVCEPLSNLALYRRCYSQLTGQRPRIDDVTTTQVKNNQINAVTACMNLLNRSTLTAAGNTTIANSSDIEVKRLLKTMHDLHSSWFLVKDIKLNTDWYYTEVAQGLWDSSSPALYYTRALLAPISSVRSILTGSDYLGTVRTNMNPLPSPANPSLLKSHVILKNPFLWAPKGDLLGVKNLPPSPNYYVSPFGSMETFNIDMYPSLGGGLVGNATYMLMNTRWSTAYNAFADGGLKMHRNYGRSVFNDLLCRSLPVVRASDTTAFVVPTSTIPFRQSANCVACHASMDRMGSVIRNYRNISAGSGADGLRGPLFPIFENQSKSAEASWPSASDKDFYARPSNGVLFFRNYLGNLVDTRIQGTAELGSSILDQDDFFICTAKRYYEYFTGFRILIDDPGRANASKSSAAEANHRDKIIQLGLELKNHNSLRTLIQSILNMPIYRDSAFGMSNQ